MKIAILSPCRLPYDRGAAERLWWGLARHFNEATRHQAELVQLPCAEDDGPGIVHAYQAFAELDLSGFDAVISGQHAAWMASHPRHICYLLQPLAMARKVADLDSDPEIAAHPGLASLAAFMRRYRAAPSALPEFFARWNELAAPGNAPAHALGRPSAMLAAALRWLDEVALSPARISRYCAVSDVAARRPGIFPPGAAVAVARPPADAAFVPGDRFEAFHSTERLERGGRIGMLIEAMSQVRTERELLIGGTGPDETRLRALARGDARIRFLGDVAEATRRERLRDALAVAILAADEEAGLLAAEAAACARAVIAPRGAESARERAGGGVLACEPDVASLAAAMQRLADEPGTARSLGRAAHDHVRGDSWSGVADAILGPAAAVARPNGKRRKLLLASTFAIHPPRHGGQSRIYHLYRALAPDFETVIVSIRSPREPAFEGEIAPGVREIRVPLSPEHERRALELAHRVGTSVIDVTMPELHALTPEISATLRREAEGACAAIASHPYLYPALAPLGLPIWYEAHNLEVHLKGALFKDRPGGARLLAAVDAVERGAAHAADLVLCSSPDDARVLVDSFGAHADRMLDVPNGTDAGRIFFTQGAERARLRARLGLKGSPRVAMFIGSGHWPNIEATKRVFEFAAALPEVVFLVVGGVCYVFDPVRKPSNVLFLGEVDDVTRNLCLQACDVALNPMEHGSGTNLKMLDFFAAGLPVITTERGSRGLRLDGERHCLVRSVAAFPAAIEEVLGSGAEAAAERALSARALVEREFDWDAIARRIMPRLLAAIERPRATP